MRRGRIAIAIGLAVVAASSVALAQRRAVPRHRPRPPALPNPNAPQPMIGWHAPTLGKTPPVDASGRPKLVLYSINRGERVELTAAGEQGGFSGSDMDRASHLLRAASGDEHPIEPRTLNIVYRLQTHFQAQEIRIISGYRVPKGTSGSNHGKGRAIDLVVPGTPDVDVAKFAREIGFVGVGIYPTSKFVHVDVRPRSYFWIDYSAPGKKNRERGILPELAQWSDQRAAARGEKGIEPFAIGGDVDAALRARAAQAPAAHGAEEDEDADEMAGGG